MTVRPRRMVSVALAASLSLPIASRAQTVQWGAKAGINRSTVGAVPDYYDSFLCCHPLFPNARVDATPGAGVVAGGFLAVPVHAWFGVQGEALIARRRHAVDFRPYESIQATFTRDYVEAAALAKLELPVTTRNRFYVASGPVLQFRIAERAESSDPSLRRGDPETNIYVVQVLAYAAPELLRTSLTSVAFSAGWVYGRVLVEARFTQGLQSIFKDREGLIAGFVKAGGHEPTLRRLAPEFARFMEAAKGRDVAVLAGVRF